MCLCDVRREKIPACFIFAHCMSAKSVWSGSRAVQSPGSAWAPCHRRRLWAAAGAVGLTWPFVVWAVPVWKNVSFTIWEAQDRAEPRFLTAGTWCGKFMCPDRWARMLLSLWSIILCVCLAANPVFLIFLSHKEKSISIKLLELLLQVWTWKVKSIKGYGCSLTFGKFWVKDMFLVFCSYV